MVALQQFLPVETAGKLLLILNTALLPIAVAWFLGRRIVPKLNLLARLCALLLHPFLMGIHPVSTRCHPLFCHAGCLGLVYAKAFRAANSDLRHDLHRHVLGSLTRLRLGGIHPRAVRTQRIELARTVQARLLSGAAVAAFSMGPPGPLRQSSVIMRPISEGSLH